MGGEKEMNDEHSDEILKEGETTRRAGAVSSSDLAVECDDDKNGGRRRYGSCHVDVER